MLNNDIKTHMNNELKAHAWQLSHEIAIGYTSKRLGIPREVVKKLFDMGLDLRDQSLMIPTVNQLRALVALLNVTGRLQHYADARGLEWIVELLKWQSEHSIALFDKCVGSLRRHGTLFTARTPSRSSL